MAIETYKVSEAAYKAIKDRVAQEMSRAWQNYRAGFENIPSFVQLFKHQSIAADWLNFIYRAGFYKSGSASGRAVSLDLSAALNRAKLRDAYGYHASNIFIKIESQETDNHG